MGYLKKSKCDELLNHVKDGNLVTCSENTFQRHLTVWSSNHPASHWWYPARYAACSCSGVAMEAPTL